MKFYQHYFTSNSFLHRSIYRRPRLLDDTGARAGVVYTDTALPSRALDSYLVWELYQIVDSLRKCVIETKDTTENAQRTC